MSATTGRKKQRNLRKKCLLRRARPVHSQHLVRRAERVSSPFPGGSAPAVANQTDKPFRAALGELLIEFDYTTLSGRPNWSAFAARLDGVHYETLRRAVTHKRVPSRRLLEECSRALGISPTYFVEYRLYLAQRDFDLRAVGYARASRNLERWTAARLRQQET